jgi:IMP cyclohydrolase
MHIPTSEIDFAADLERGQESMLNNDYPGRWLAMGRGEGVHEAEFFLGYSFGGRSDGSKNRTAITEGNAIRLVAPGMTLEEMAQVPDAALIYYHPIDTREGVFAISNGAQTRPVLEAVVEGASFEEAVTNAPVVKGMMNGEEVGIDLSSYEPDAPINTPRITGILDLRPEAVTAFGLAVVRKNLETEEAIREFYTADLDDIAPGQGWAIQTYGNNDPDDKKTPVPHFDQAPYGFDMGGGTTHIAMRVRRRIGEKTFAAVVVRAIDMSSRQFSGNTIINTRG